MWAVAAVAAFAAFLPLLLLLFLNLLASWELRLRFFSLR